MNKYIVCVGNGGTIDGGYWICFGNARNKYGSCETQVGYVGTAIAFT